MVRFILRRYCIYLFHKNQCLLIDLATKYGLDAIIMEDITIRNLYLRMDDAFLWGIKHEEDLQELQGLVKLMKEYRAELRRLLSE